MLEESFLVREAQRNHLEGMLLKRKFKQQTAASVTGVIRCDFGTKNIRQIQVGTNLLGTASNAGTRVPEFLVVFGRRVVGFNQILCG